MKQKNMILVGVAVVCGLIAAVLTSQMGAKGRAKVDEVAIPVALKEIPIGTRIPAEDVAKWVKMKTFPKDNAPQGIEYIPTLEDMAGKYVMNRTYRPDEPFNKLDVSSTGMMAPPEGYGMMSLPIQPDAAVSGFIRPGTHVDVWASVQKRKNSQYVAFPMFLDMLVLAVNQDATGVASGGGAYQAVSMVSMAVKPEHTELFQLAIARGAQLRLVMRHPDQDKVSKYGNELTVNAIRDILTDKEKDDDKPAVVAAPPVVKPETVTIKVATKDLPAQTELTAELIAGAFKDREFPLDQVPANAIRRLSEHVGRFLQKDLAENQFVPQAYLGAKTPEVAPPPVAVKEPKPDVKPAPGPDVAGPKAEPPELPKKVVRKPTPQYEYLSMSGASGTIWIRFEKLPNGELRKIGPVTAADLPEPPAKDESKADNSGRTL